MTHSKFFISKIKYFIILLLVSTLVFSMFSSQTRAADESGRLSDIVADKSQMDREYSFVAKFLEGITKVEPFGDGWKYSEKSTTSGFNAYSFWSNENLDDSQKGEIGVKYINVGTAKGQVLDLKITFNDWVKNNNPKLPTFIALTNNEISFIDSNMISSVQEWEFLISGTDEPIEISGYMTMQDIDALQGVTFDKETSLNLHSFYVSNKTNNTIQYTKKDGQYSFFGESADVNISNQNAWFTFTFKGSKLTFEWDAAIDRSGYPWTIFLFTAIKPVQSATTIPTKSVVALDASSNETYSFSDINERFAYTIFHTIPQEVKVNYYSSYEIMDILPECLELKAENVRIVDEKKSDWTDRFNIFVEDNMFKATAKSETLESAGFYFNTFSFIINTKIKEDADLSKYWDTDKGGYVFTNIASAAVDGSSEESNKATVILEPLEPSYVITYEFETTSGRDLPEEILSMLPSNQTVLKGQTITIKEPVRTEVIVEDGVWHFKAWDTDDFMVSGDKLVAGTWIFEENPLSKPDETTMTSEPQPTTVEVTTISSTTEKTEVMQTMEETQVPSNQGNPPSGAEETTTSVINIQPTTTNESEPTTTRMGEQQLATEGTEAVTTAKETPVLPHSNKPQSNIPKTGESASSFVGILSFLGISFLTVVAIRKKRNSSSEK